MKKRNCAVLGSAPMNFPWGYDEEDERCGALKLLLMNTISYWRSEGIASYVVPLDAGIGLYTAEIINSLREKDSEIALTCIIPWEGQATKWTPELRNRYFDVQAKCSDVEIVSPQKTASCEAAARLRAIDLSDSVVAVTAGEENELLEVALHYARQLHKKILTFDTDKIVMNIE